MPIQQMLLAPPQDVAYASFTTTGKASGVGLSGNNLIATWSSNGGGVKVDKAVLTGEYKYWEVVVTNLVSSISPGISVAALDVSSNATTDVAAVSGGTGWTGAFIKGNGVNQVSTGGIFPATSDVIGFAYDRTGSGSFILRKNNTIIATWTGIGSQDMMPTLVASASGTILTLQTGNLTYALPSGASKLTL